MQTAQEKPRTFTGGFWLLTRTDRTTRSSFPKPMRPAAAQTSAASWSFFPHRPQAAPRAARLQFESLVTALRSCLGGLRRDPILAKMLLILASCSERSRQRDLSQLRFGLLLAPWPRSPSSIRRRSSRRPTAPTVPHAHRAPARAHTHFIRHNGRRLLDHADRHLRAPRPILRQDQRRAGSTSPPFPVEAAP